MTKRLLALIGAFAICKLSHSQTIVYSYDESGNRVRKEVKKTTRGISGDDMFEDSEDASPANKNLTVSEKNGKITILIKELDQDTPYEISLYSTNAILLYSKTIDTNSTTVSLTEYPAGTYVLTIKHKEETTTYKFSKK